MTHAGCSHERPTINDIFRIHGPKYLEKYQERMSRDQIKAAYAIMNCRSPKLGMVVYKCQDCGKLHHVPKSCGNRHCPTCQAGKAKDWLEEALERILPKIPNSVWSSAWLVNSQAVADGRGALSYKPSYTQSYKTMTVTAEEFLRRFLQHVLPSGFRKVRHFGFEHKRAKVPWEWLTMLVTITLNMVYTFTVAMKPIRQPKTLACPDCGGLLICLGFVPPVILFDSS